MTVFWIVLNPSGWSGALGIILVLLVGQGLLAATLLKVVRTLGEYTDRLARTHQQNLQLRQNLATMGNEIALGELLRRNPQPGKEKIS